MEIKASGGEFAYLMETFAALCSNITLESLDCSIVSGNTGTFGFGFALEALKQGKRVRRIGWNGKDMFIFLASGDDLTSCICSKDMPPCTDSICIKTADNKICVGWLASQNDMLAEDWIVVE